MNLHARISKIEAAQPLTASAVIVATDEADFSKQLEDALLSSEPGSLHVTGSIGREPYDQMHNLLPFEEALELLS
ncbi:hypothetical protein [Mesorhizobium sp. KR9-304]|uniref:hypothetical protein n=1 Tax=Mesorhizobium sp. KR9-304 TaxID=3156614 RepID=UPI0032B368CA